jgi:inorganic pyrophosphatase
LCERINHFFRHYKELEGGKWAAVEGWADADEAAALIAAAVAWAAG